MRIIAMFEHIGTYYKLLVYVYLYCLNKLILTLQISFKLQDFKIY